MKIKDLPEELRPRTISLLYVRERALGHTSASAYDESELCETCLGTGLNDHGKDCPDCRGMGMISAW